MGGRGKDWEVCSPFEKKKKVEAIFIWLAIHPFGSSRTAEYDMA